MALATSRTLVVLKALADSPEPLALAQLAQKTEIGRASLSRLLPLLVEEGAVRLHAESGKYALGFWGWQIGASAVTRNGIRTIAFPRILELAAAVQSTVNFALADGEYAVFIESIEPRSGGLTSRISMARYRLLDNASGRVMAAFLPAERQEALLAAFGTAHTEFTKGREELGADLQEIAARGYATIDREHRLDLSGIAVPILNHEGTPVAALGLPLYGPLDNRFVERTVPVAMAASRAISLELGYRRSEIFQIA